MDTKSKLKSIPSFFIKHIFISIIILVGLFITADYFEQMSRYTKYNGPMTRESIDATVKLENFSGDKNIVAYEILGTTKYLSLYKEASNHKSMANDFYKQQHIKYVVFNKVDKALFTNSKEVYDKYNLGEDQFILDKLIREDAKPKYLDGFNLSGSNFDDMDDKGNSYTKNPEKYEFRFWIPRYEFVNDGEFAIIDKEKNICKKKQETYFILYIASVATMVLIVLMIIFGNRKLLKETIQNLYLYKIVKLILKWINSVFFELFTKKGITFKVIVVGTLVIIGMFQGVVLGYGWNFEFMAVLFLGVVICLVYMINLSMDLRKIEDYTSDSSSAEFKDKVRSYNLKILAKDIEDLKMGYSDAVNDRIKNERLKAELVTNISHDLKTPLTSIINYTDILLNKDI
ncbi:MAG: hypothetical protein RR637_08765, partial [Clostridium sp.]